MFFSIAISFIFIPSLQVNVRKQFLRKLKVQKLTYICNLSGERESDLGTNKDFPKLFFFSVLIQRIRKLNFRECVFI